MQETVNWSSKLNFFQKKVVGDSRLYVRKVDERHKIVRQTDSGLGVDARESPGRPWSPEALLNSSLPHDLCHGWDLPCWLPARTISNSLRDSVDSQSRKSSQI